jgi:hypothetical protein
MRCLQFTALINIRPGRGNRSMEVEDPAAREVIRQVVSVVVGAGEPL